MTGSDNPVREAFARACNSYDMAAVLQREVLARLLERLGELNIEPSATLDVGAGTGSGARAVKKRYPRASVIALDFALPMLQQLQRRSGWWRKPRVVCADAEQLPFAAASFDLIFSSLTFQWCRDLPALWLEIRRTLRDNGVLLFATLGPDTLTELRSAWAEVDDLAHVNTFIDMHDIGDSLLRAGFSDPVLDVERITLNYADVAAVLRELKALGANTVTGGAYRRGLTGRQRFAAMQRAYQRYRTADGRYPATFEVIFAVAWQRQRTAATDEAPLVFVPPDSLQRQPK